MPPPSDPAAVTAAFAMVATPRLTLRRPSEEDRAAYVTLHTDPALYRHAPHARVAPAAASEAFDRLLESWTGDGFGYWVVRERNGGETVGFAGVRPDGDTTVNLYYRFAATAHGRGLGREAARAAVVTAAEWLPRRRVEAVVSDANPASARTARAAGLDRVAATRHSSDPPGAGPSSRYAAPTLTRVDALDDATRAEVLDLWGRVTDAGGSVGFLPGAPRTRIAQALADHEAQMADGSAYVGSLRRADGRLVGWGWWVGSANPLLAHGRWLYRLMVDPELQGRNLGAILLAGLIGLARNEGAELLILGYRSGSGLGDFYARHGFVEAGRVPGAIRVALGDDRDDVTMARRVDRRPLVGDGRT